jgi:hypothetical protein
MNKKINELAERANIEKRPNISGNGWDYTIFEFQLEKFANLIINECINVLHTEQDRLDTIPGREMSSQGMELAMVYINNHFMRHEIKKGCQI